MNIRDKKTQRRRFKVGVRKEYFPKALHPKLFGEAYVEVVQVFSTSRTEAAQKAWEANGHRWLRQMKDTVRQVSLEVNEPTIGVGGLVGRLAPVTVWKKG